jgi:hypothetical protein
MPISPGVLYVIIQIALLVVVWLVWYLTGGGI